MKPQECDDDSEAAMLLFPLSLRQRRPNGVQLRNPLHTFNDKGHPA
jgi:hypothetical protein